MSELTNFPPDALLRASLEVALAPVVGPLVLAVSGGRDSMVLLQAMARWAPERIAAVATFDHGTGRYATDASSLVAAESRRLGLTVVRERSRTPGHSEAAWRTARWDFLGRIARAFKAQVVTAHTRDDQLETVVMRIMRGAGARGLAALAAPSRVVRPWLGVSRAELARWATLETVAYLEDPMNVSRAFLRGRVRHELLPALETATPGFSDQILAIADQAAVWRREVEQYVDAFGLVVSASRERASCPAVALESTSCDGRAVLWPAVCARAGVTLNAKGTRELVKFTTAGRRGSSIRVSGGAIVLRRGAAAGEPAGDQFEVRRVPTPRRRDGAPAWAGVSETVPPRFGGFRWRRLLTAPTPDAHSEPDLWTMGFSRGEQVALRVWTAGDRIRTVGAPAGRRVTRYFSEAHVPALDRPSWPVVLVDNEPVWVPGVCRSLAAPSRPGRSELIWYRCEPEFD
ncbi:tRNA lysidine(34) synthetase TilS [Gemmatimonas sp.]|uniref:tRNA lysidine(34) synthetase TilS n=1 Tax=Gemmatimonas sp. TaxID=1962908 RepID=UPI0039835297